MGTQRLVVARRAAAAVVLALLSAPALAQGPEAEPLEPVFSSLAETWAAERVPEPAVFGPGGSIGSLFSARTFAGSRRFSIEAAQGHSLPGVRLRGRGQRDDGVNWVFARPLDGFSTGFDQFGNPAVGTIDIRDQARNYVKQKLISEILSKTAFGRGLSVFIDSGKTGLDPERSRLLPFISPKVNAREGKAALTLTWKF
jgi:hypothetical protein